MGSSIGMNGQTAGYGFQVPRATAGTNSASPGGGKSSVLPCSALMYAVISSFTTSTPSSHVSSGSSPVRKQPVKWRAPGS